MGRKYSADLVLIYFIPALVRDPVFIAQHEARVQVSGKSKAFIQDQSHTVIAVPGRMQDLTIDIEAGKKFAALLQFHKGIIVFLYLNIRIIFCFEEFMKRGNEVTLTFQQDKFYSFILEFLHKTCMVWMKMCNQQIFYLLE